MIIASFAFLLLIGYQAIAASFRRGSYLLAIAIVFLLFMFLAGVIPL